MGSAQAMMDCAKPLLEKLDMEEEYSLNKVFSVAQLYWNLALVKDKKEQAKMKRASLKQIDFPDTENLLTL